MSPGPTADNRSPDVQARKVSILEALRAFPALQPLVEPLVAAFGEAPASLAWFGIPAGTIPFREGNPSDDEFILLSGRLGVLLGADACPRLVAHIDPGELVGEMAVISGQPRSATVIAVHDSDLIRLPNTTLYSMMRANFEVVDFLLRLLVARLRNTSREVVVDQGLPCIAVVPLSDVMTDTAYADRLTKAFARLFPQVETISWAHSEDEADRVGGAKQASELIYLGDTQAPGWNRHCMRQSDRIIFVANSNVPMPARAREAIAFAKELHRDSQLVLINPQNADLPTGGAAWLDIFSAENILHVRSGRSSDYERVARVTCGRGIGVVFSGGGVRGFAHVGVIAAFSEAGIPIDAVGGTSLGSLVAGLAAADFAPTVIAAKLHEGCVDTNPFGDYTLPINSLVRGRRLNRILKKHCGEIAIENLWKMFFCVSANLSTGELNVHNSGSLWRAVRASAAIPGIFPPWIVDGHVLVDGAIMNNLPTNVMRSLRRGIVVGVDVSAETNFLAQATEIEEKSLIWRLRKGRREAPSLLRILTRSAMINGEAQNAASRTAADLLIRPDVGAIPLLAFKQFDRAMEAGYRAGKGAVEELNRIVTTL